jgi:transaldolase
MNKLESLRVKIFADGADKTGMIEMYEKPFIKGLTTNPTLMRMAGVTDYEAFATDILKTVKDKPISFEVLSDDLNEMHMQALKIASWSENVYVKIPVTNTKGISTGSLIKDLSEQGVKINVTAIMTLSQVREVIFNLHSDTPAFVSVFAGRIADTGVDPLPVMAEAVEILKIKPKTELIWASPRELLNVFHAEMINCHVITVTNDILKKLSLIDYNLTTFSLDTVKMFYKDAIAAGFKL